MPDTYTARLACGHNTKVTIAPGQPVPAALWCDTCGKATPVQGVN